MIYSFQGNYLYIDGEKNLLCEGYTEAEMIVLVAKYQADADAPQIDITHGAILSPLAQAKLTQISTLKAAYTTAIQLPVAYMATTFQADDYSRKVLTECLAGDTVPDDFYWLDANNVKVPMTYVQAKGLANAMLVQNQPLFNNLFTKKTAVRDALTVADVLLVQW